MKNKVELYFKYFPMIAKRNRSFTISPKWLNNLKLKVRTQMARFEYTLKENIFCCCTTFKYVPF